MLWLPPVVLGAEQPRISLVQPGPAPPAAPSQIASIAVSPDGLHLYASSYDDYLVVFERRGSYGELSIGTPRQLYRVKAGLTLSADGAYLYSGTGSSHCCEGGVRVFARDSVTGALTFLQQITDQDPLGLLIASPWSMRLSPDENHLHIGTADGMNIFSRDAGTGKLTPLTRLSEAAPGVPMPGPRHFAFSPDGASVYVGSSSNLDPAAVFVFDRDVSTGALTFREVHRDGVGGVSLGAVGSVNVSGDGNQVYAGTDLARFDRDASGSLSFAGNDAAGVFSAYQRLSPDDSTMYVMSGADVAVFSRNPLDGVLTLEDQILGQPAQGGVVSPDGVHLYTFYPYAIRAYERNPTTNDLALRQEVLFGELAPTADRGLAYSPDGAFLYEAAETEGALRIYAIDPNSGVTTAIGSVVIAAVDNVTAVVVSADGAHLYTASRSGVVAAFERDAGTGALTFLESQVDGSGGVDGIAGARSLTLSPDGKHLYVAGGLDDAVAVFERAPVSGLLTFVEVQHDGAGGVDGLAGASSIAVSPDGTHVYAAGFHDNAVAAFTRNAATGALTFVQMVRDGVGGVDGLAGVSSLVVSPDGARVYAGGHEDQRLAVFVRNAATGELTFAESVFANPARSLAISADGTRLIAGGRLSVAVYLRNPATGSLERAGEPPFRTSLAAALSPDGRLLWSRVEGGVETYELLPTCSPTPLASCRQPGRSSLMVKDSTNDKQDRVRYKWQSGDDSPASALGDPDSGSTNYQVCLYANGANVVSLGAEHGAKCGPFFNRDCWSRRFVDFVYSDADASRDGIRLLSLRPTTTKAPRILLKAKGDAMPSLPPFPIALPVTVQVVNSLGECWASTFGGTDVARNQTLSAGGGLFRARQ